MRPLNREYYMKPSLTHFAVVLALMTSSPALATDLGKAGKAQPEEGGLHKAASMDKKQLKELREVLGKINTELKNSDMKADDDMVVAYSEKQVTETHTIETETVIATETVNDLSAYKTLEISYPGDVEMQCGKLSEEAGTMRDIIYTTQDIKDKAKMRKNGIKAAGAIGSFLVGSVTGGVGLAVGGFLLDQGVDEARTNADDFQDTAEQRRTLMMGIYNAKGCYGPLDHAMQNPEIFDPLSFDVTTVSQRDDYEFNQ